MDAFESLVATLLRREGYWTASSVKVELTKAEKRRIGKHTTPRWEIDLVAYKPIGNRLLAVECKSLLYSTGVVFRRGKFESERRYKMFADTRLRAVVLGRLVRQLREADMVRGRPQVTLCLAAGHVARKTDRAALDRHFKRNCWRLFDATWVCDRLTSAASAGYENDIAHVVAKLMREAQAAAWREHSRLRADDDPDDE